MKFKSLLCFLILLTCYQGEAQTRVKGLEEKLQQLKDLTAKKSVINLNLSRFKEFVKAAPRDYSFIVMFTAMSPARRCAICQYVYEEFMITANSFRYSQSFNDKLFFGIVDFDESSDVFQMLRLNSAPIIKHFPAKGKPKPRDTMDTDRGIQAEAMVKWIQDRTDIQIRLFRPPNYSGVFAFSFLFIMAGGFLYFRRNHLEFLYNKQMWAVLAVSVCLAMISGQMWNQIRGPPLYHKTRTGVNYISSGSHGQTIMESYIIVLLNAAVISGMILMIEASGGVRDEKARTYVTDFKNRKMAAFVGLVLVSVFFSLLLSVFRMKTQGYPYSFLFK